MDFHLSHTKTLLRKSGNESQWSHSRVVAAWSLNVESLLQPITNRDYTLHSLLHRCFGLDSEPRFPLIIVYPLPIAKNMGPLPASEWARAFQSSCLFSMTWWILLANSTRLRCSPVPRRPQDDLPRGLQWCWPTEWDGLSEHPSLHSYLVNLANLDVCWDGFGCWWNSDDLKKHLKKHFGIAMGILYDFMATCGFEWRYWDNLW